MIINFKKQYLLYIGCIGLIVTLFIIISPNIVAFVIGIVDWFSRKVLAYNVVNTMDAFHCVETLKPQGIGLQCSKYNGRFSLC